MKERTFVPVRQIKRRVAFADLSLDAREEIPLRQVGGYLVFPRWRVTTWDVDATGAAQWDGAVSWEWDDEGEGAT